MSTLVSIPDHYRIEETIRRDCYTSTYRALDDRTGCQVIIKAVQPLSWLDATETANRNLSLRNVFNCLSATENSCLRTSRLIDAENSGLLAVRDYENAPTLRARIDRHRLLSVDEALWIALQAGEALDSIRRCGSSHGSVTPENLVIQSDGSPIILDPAFRHSVSAVNIAGTACRFAPRMGRRGDVAQLAATLFEGLTGVTASARAINAARELPARTRYALSRAFTSEKYLSGAEFTAALSPRSQTSAFRLVWRPAAAAGLLGSLATIGGYASSERRDQAKVSAIAVQTVNPDPIPSVAAVPITDQDKRVVQLAFRRHGTAALSDATIAEIFRLTDAQRDEIDAILGDQRSRVAGIVERAAGGNSTDTGAEMKQMRHEMNHRILRTLTESQQLAWANSNTDSAAPAPGEPVL